MCCAGAGLLLFGASEKEARKVDGSGASEASENRWPGIIGGDAVRTRHQTPHLIQDRLISPRQLRCQNRPRNEYGGTSA